LARTTTAAATTTTTTTTTINFEVYTLTFHGDRPKTTSGECSPASSELNIQSRACQSFIIVWGSFASLSQDGPLYRTLTCAPVQGGSQDSLPHR